MKKKIAFGNRKEISIGSSSSISVKNVNDCICMKSKIINSLCRSQNTSDYYFIIVKSVSLLPFGVVIHYIQDANIYTSTS